MEFIVKNHIFTPGIDIPYNVVEGFDDPNGKFPNTLGNVALVDCHYVPL